MKSDNRKSFQMEDWQIDPAADRVSRGDETYSLRPKTMDVLVYLAERRGEVASADELIEELWPGVFVSDASVYACINQLREALGDHKDHPRYIETIPKRGYRLIVPVIFDGDAPAAVSTDAGGTKNYRLVGLAAALLLVIAAFYAFRQGDEPAGQQIQPPAEASIAVMPFIDLSPGSDQEYFSDGISEELLNSLASVSGLRVTGRTSSFSFKGSEPSIMEIGEALGVATLLEGSVRREGDRVRIAAQLVSTKDGFQIWSNAYEREVSSVFEVQKEIAGSIVAALEVFLGADRRTSFSFGDGRIEQVSTENVAAFEKYLQGLQQKNIGSSASLLLAEISFKEALAQDPDYHQARLELAYTYWRQLRNGVIAFSEASEKVEPLMDRLLEEKPKDGLVLLLAANIQRRGFILQGDKEFDVAKHVAELTAAIERMPNEPRLYHAVTRLLRNSNQPEEALHWLDQGTVIDPLDWELHYYRGNIRWSLGDVDGAEASYARAIELNPENPNNYVFAAEIPWHRKQFAESFAMLRKAMELDPLDHEIPAGIAFRLYTFGLMDEGDKYLQRASAIAQDNAFVQSIRLYRLLLLGDYQKAREMSETLLRNDIDDRWGSYRWAVMVFVSAMAELGMTGEALAILEELRSGVSSPDFHPQDNKDQVLQYSAVLTLARSQLKEETRSVLAEVTLRWDESFPFWRNVSHLVAPIAMAQGQTEFAVDLTLENLASGVELPSGIRSYLIYRHIDHYKELATEPAVAARLKELDAEAKKAGEETWAYIVEQQLQL